VSTGSSDAAIRQEHQQVSSSAREQAEASHKKVAIVHDWLIGGGAEKVVLELHKIFPEAPIFTSYATNEWREKLDGKVITGHLQYWPFSALRKFLPVLRLWWFRSLDLSGYDLVISTSGNGEAKHIRTPKTVKHICYCHTPPHFLWRHYDVYLKNPGFGLFNPIARAGLRLLLKPLRKADFKAAQRVDKFIANSTHIKNDIQKYYARDSVVIQPPVDTNRFQQIVSDHERSGFITVGRLVPHKHTDIIVQACTDLDVPLTVVGQGPELNRLKDMAGGKIRFVVGASDKEVVSLMSSAEAFLFASHDDFGITPVEALASGMPVIAYKAGGALDYVVSGKTGEFFDDQTVDALKTAIRAFEKNHYKVKDAQNIAAKFAPAVFARKLKEFIQAQH
jgi:glycosyltransferase involved in cell wall biosynthesis